MSLRLATLALVFSGCALLSRSKPRELRTFTPEAARTCDSRESGREAVARLKLGPVRSGADLRLRILRRESAHELDHYETLQWSEYPEAYVRRALTCELFERRPLEEVVTGPLPTLEVELLEFEDVAAAPAHLGRVVLRYRLTRDEAVLDRGEVVAERPAASPAIEQTVAAIGAAMNQATSQLADRVLAALASQPEHPPSAGR